MTLTPLALNPWTWVVAGVTSLALLAGAFGGGFYTAVKVYAKASAGAAVVAAKTQQAYDIKDHTFAIKYDIVFKPGEFAHETKIKYITRVIHDHEPAAPAVCNLAPKVADDLNSAGVY